MILALVSSWRAPRRYLPRNGGAIVASLHAFVLHGTDLMKKMWAAFASSVPGLVMSALSVPDWMA